MPQFPSSFINAIQATIRVRYARYTRQYIFDDIYLLRIYLRTKSSFEQTDTE